MHVNEQKLSKNHSSKPNKNGSTKTMEYMRLNAETGSSNSSVDEMSDMHLSNQLW